jgi:hypothetical protein
VLAGCDEDGAELTDDALGEADGTVVDDVTSGPTDAGTDTEDVCPAGCSSWVDGCPVNEVNANAAAPPAPTRPPRISATTSGFIRRRRGGGWPVPDGIGGGVAGGYAPIGGVGCALPAVAVSAPAPVYGQLPGAGVRGPDGPAGVRGPDGPAGPEPPPAVCVAPRAAGGAAATAAPAAAAATGPDQAKLGRDGVPWAYVRVNDSGSQVPPGCRAPTSASRPLAVGRC